MLKIILLWLVEVFKFFLNITLRVRGHFVLICLGLAISFLNDLRLRSFLMNFIGRFRYHTLLMANIANASDQRSLSLQSLPRIVL